MEKKTNYSLLYFMVIVFPSSIYFMRLYDIPYLGSVSSAIIRVSVFLYLMDLIVKKENVKIPFYPLFLFWSVNILSVLWSNDFEETLLNIPSSIIQYFIILVILNHIIKSKKDIENIIMTYITFSFISMLVILFMITTGYSPEYIKGDRLTVLGEDPNALSYFYCVGMVFVRDFFGKNQKEEIKNVNIRIILTLSFILFPVAIIATGSRTGFVMYVFVLFTFLSSKKSAITAFLSIVVILVILNFSGHDPFSFFEERNVERVMETGEQIEDADLTGRVDIWKDSLEIFKDYPFWGVGFSVSNIEIGKITSNPVLTEDGRLRRAAHNVFIQVLLENGAFGFLVFIFSLFLIIKKVMIKSCRKSTWIIFYVVSGIAGMTLSNLIYWPVFIVFSFLSLKEVDFEDNENPDNH